MSIILYAILVFIAYQVIFKFVIPIYRATRRFKDGFREMQEKMNQPSHRKQSSDQQTSQTKPKAGDYIEFEEIK
jgi:hypothetical protein